MVLEQGRQAWATGSGQSEKRGEFLDAGRRRISLLALGVGLLLWMLAACDSAPDPIVDPSHVARGKSVAARCVVCHDLDRRNHLVGPHLVGVLGRRAGTVSGFRFSDAMAGSDITWTDEQLSRFLTDPVGMFPGTAMVIAPLSAAEASQLILYLKELD